MYISRPHRDIAMAFAFYCKVCKVLKAILVLLSNLESIYEALKKSGKDRSARDRQYFESTQRNKSHWLPSLGEAREPATIDSN